MLGRAHGGVLSALFESVKRDGRENMRGVRRRALRGGGRGAEEQEDDETRHLHYLSEKYPPSLVCCVCFRRRLC